MITGVGGNYGFDNFDVDNPDNAEGPDSGLDGFDDLAVMEPLATQAMPVKSHHCPCCCWQDLCSSKVTTIFPPQLRKCLMLV